MGYSVMVLYHFVILMPIAVVRESDFIISLSSCLTSELDSFSCVISDYFSHFKST
jgi:hypothetical protein